MKEPEIGRTYRAVDLTGEPYLRLTLERLAEVPYGWYWRVLDLESGMVFLMIDNSFHNWEAL